MTFTYFIPTMVRLTDNKTYQGPAAVAKAEQWVKLGYVRHAATLIAWLTALRALTLLS